MNRILALTLAVAFPLAVCAQVAPPGQIQGSASEHTAASAKDVIESGWLVLPAAAAGGRIYSGLWREAPRSDSPRVPVVIFMHGSSGLGLAVIREWQVWLAGLGFASFAPDSFALPGRVTYVSPVDKGTYERIHAMRAAEARMAIAAVKQARWADPKRVVLAGTSEGAVAVARFDGDEVIGRIVYSWSCENNYFVEAHRTAVRPGQPLLNVISASDPYFSPSNPWLGNPQARGHCASAWSDSKSDASIVLIPGAPHTLINLPPARRATEAFLQSVIGT